MTEISRRFEVTADDGRLLRVGGLRERAGASRFAAADPLESFSEGAFVDAEGTSRTYYQTGSGPAVMVLHEAYGLTSSDLDFCRRLAAEGFTVYAPVLFGTPGKPPKAIDRLRNFAHICISGEFAIFSQSRSSPIADSLRSLGRDIVANRAPPKLGVIGLCLTGNFALAMMADEHLVAPVMGEPALPFGYSESARASIGLSSNEIDTVKRRIAGGAKILGYRFTPDTICPKQRFRTLEQTFGEAFEGHCIDPSPRRGQHCVFTHDYDPDWAPTRDAFARLVTFLRERLYS